MKDAGTKIAVILIALIMLIGIFGESMNPSSIPSWLDSNKIILLFGVVILFVAVFVITYFLKKLR